VSNQTSSSSCFPFRRFAFSCFRPARRFITELLVHAEALKMWAREYEMGWELCL
jgi:hypothetical protein